MMNNNTSNSSNDIKYADLHEPEEKRLKEIEQQFNSEFGTEYYLMVMKKS
ncbi:polynucleotide phosphorylase [Clostridium sp. UBA6640]|nr:polynucleotide phosphorylase [Clostridium sp. UBA6640]